MSTTPAAPTIDIGISEQDRPAIADGLTQRLQVHETTARMLRSMLA